MSAAASTAEARRGGLARFRANVASGDELPGGLDWQAFSERCFPGRYRHDLEALIAYGSYRRLPRVVEPKSLESTWDPVESAEEPQRVEQAKSGAVVEAALQAWEEEGGAPFRTRAARRRPSPDSTASSRRAD
jgi:hypothetical protein